MESTLPLSTLSITPSPQIRLPPPLPTHPEIQSNPAGPGPLTENPFPFLLLPFEIRLKIYAAINHTPRTVSIAYKTSFNKPPPGKPKVLPVNYGSAGPPRSNLVSTVAPTPESMQRAARYNLHPQATSRFSSRWTSSTAPPILLSVSKETREEALKAYRLSFGCLEAPATIYFNFEVDTLWFQGFAAYQLDLFLGGDVYGGCDADIGMVGRLRLDVPEELYGRRSFCWGDIRGFRNLKEVELVLSEGNDSAMPERESMMGFYERSLRRVWDAYVEGNGEGIEGEGELWEVPEIRVWDSGRNVSWGRVELKVDE